jgi:hypothetical protein
VLIKDGLIINKWSSRNIPGETDLQAPLEDSVLGVSPINHDTRNIGIIALALLVSLFILWTFGKKTKYN